MANFSKLAQRNEVICAGGIAAAALLLLISKYSRDAR